MKRTVRKVSYTAACPACSRDTEWEGEMAERMIPLDGLEEWTTTLRVTVNCWCDGEAA